MVVLLSYAKSRSERFHHQDLIPEKSVEALKRRLDFIFNIKRRRD